MEPESQSHLLRFDEFEINLRTRELRRQGQLIRLQDLPVRLLILLATRPGELVTREEIEHELWGDEHFVDFDHGINTAMRKVREALNESTEAPRFIETLPRKGYRFLVQVQRGNGLVAAPLLQEETPGDTIGPVSDPLPAPLLASSNAETQPASAGFTAVNVAPPNDPPADDPPASNADNFTLPSGPSRQLFLLTQAGYLAMYCATLFKLEPAGRVLERFFSIPPDASLSALIPLSLCGIAVRLFLLTAVGLKHPSAGLKYRKLFPLVLLLDIVWAAAPLLLVEKLGVGLAMAGIAGLAYLPFSQRILMNSIYPNYSAEQP